MDRLAKKGEAVTVDRVTKTLGGGSTTTIRGFIGNWRKLQDIKRLSEGRLGTALAATIEQFWDEISSTLATEQADLVQELEHELETLRTTLRHLEDENLSLKTELRVLRTQESRKKR